VEKDQDPCDQSRRAAHPARQLGVLFSRHKAGSPQYNIANGMQLYLRPYVMFANAPHSRETEWYNLFTNERIPANIKANNEGYNDKHDFSLTEPYRKAGNELVVLFVGGSTAWGVGATSVETTIAGHIGYHLNAMQKDLKYTIINFDMGSWIAYRQFIGLELWGRPSIPIGSS